MPVVVKAGTHRQRRGWGVIARLRLQTQKVMQKALGCHGNSNIWLRRSQGFLKAYGRQHTTRTHSNERRSALLKEPGCFRFYFAWHCKPPMAQFPFTKGKSSPPRGLALLRYCRHGRCAEKQTFLAALSVLANLSPICAICTSADVAVFLVNYSVIMSQPSV